MASRKLSEEEIAKLQIDARSAVPYSEEEINTFDNPNYDFDRSRATLARKLLKMCDVPLEEDSEASDE